MSEEKRLMLYSDTEGYQSKYEHMKWLHERIVNLLQRGELQKNDVILMRDSFCELANTDSYSKLKAVLSINNDIDIFAKDPYDARDYTYITILAGVSLKDSANNGKLTDMTTRRKLFDAMSEYTKVKSGNDFINNLFDNENIWKKEVMRNFSRLLKILMSNGELDLYDVCIALDSWGINSRNKFRYTPLQYVKFLQKKRAESDSETESDN